jgi:CCDC81-like prokaryotic HU domain 1/CCDC81-like prokaryotic HU domain 2/SPOR domain
MGIERDLQDLLFCHDCVIVPQWGGFLTHYRPARLDEARRQVHPPGKDLSFNRHLVRNDGLLADHLAKREGIGFDVAIARIDAEVAGWREALDRSGRLELPHIGIFFRDAERNLQFDPDRRANYLRDAFGLRPLAAVPVERAKPNPVVIPLPAAPPVVVNEVRRSPVAWVAAGIAVLLFGSAAVWAYRSGIADNTQWSGFFAWKPDTTAAYVAPSTASIFPVTSAPSFELPEGDTGIRTLPIALNDTVHITVDLGRATSVAAADTTAVAIRPKVVGDAHLRYHVIGGCFAQPENADKLLDDLVTKGYPARRLRQRGLLHPVAYGSFATRNEALAMLKGLRAQDGRAAWLLVR